MITIPFNPNLIGGSGSSFVLSWHGFLSFVGVAVAIYLVARWARRDNVDTEIIYYTAVWAIIGGIIGARVVHVVDYWHIYEGNLGQVFAIWSGGIGLWGAILGGWLTGSAYAYFQKYPIGRLMDLTAPALLIAQTIGRVGDIINGEHCSRATDLIWGWVFTHPDSPGRYCILNDQQGYFGESATSNTPVHPAVVYEMIWNMISLAIVWRLRDRLTPDGSLWMVYLALYAIGRFSVQWVRLDAVKFAGLQEAHIIAILVLAVAVPFLVLKTRFVIRSGASGDHQVARGRRRRKAQAGQT